VNYRSPVVEVTAVLVLAGCVTLAGCGAGGVGRSGSAQTFTIVGPAVAAPVIIPANGHPTVRSLQHYNAQKEVLFVSDPANMQIVLYDPKVANPSPEGAITVGIEHGVGLATDKTGTLYVANETNSNESSITIYPRGKTSPSLTITAGLNEPDGITVDSHGTVYASNLGTNTVTTYKAGQTSVFQTIDFPQGSQAVGLAVDSKDNLYVASDTNNEVLEVPHGSTTPRNLGLTGTSAPTWLAFRNNDVLYVSNFTGNNATIYKKGQTAPYATITDDMDGPTTSGFARPGIYFQGNQNSSLIYGYKRGRSKPFSTITGISAPHGIASDPMQPV
jgi:serine/threonine-protein kinase